LSIVHRSIWITLSAALVALRLAGGAQAALTVTQLDIIEELVESGNWADLRAFLQANPSLLRGDDALAEAFRNFLENTSSLYTALTFDDAMFPDIANVDPSLIITPPPPPPPPPPPAPTRAEQDTGGTIY
jgi:hypothetical protein